MGSLEASSEEPLGRLAACLEELGYHFQEGELGIQITGHASNPDPDFQEVGKMTSRAVKDLNEYMTHGCHRMGHDEVAPAVHDS